MYATRKEIAQLIQRTIKTADDAKFKNVHALSSHETIASHADVLSGSSCERNDDYQGSFEIELFNCSKGS